MNECIFCKIVAGEMPAYKIYEDEKYLVFLDIVPKTTAQMLVIPKEHFSWVWDLPIDRQVSPNLGEYFEVVGKVARHIREITRQPVRQMVYGFQVSHAHIQIRPGREDDLSGELASPEKLSEWQKMFKMK
jgi:histidine triad (HIT) family protein